MSYRVDVVFEGAVESMEDHETFEGAMAHYDHLRDELTKTHPHKHWQVDLYDTRPYPPEVVESHIHDETTLMAQEINRLLVESMVALTDLDDINTDDVKARLLGLEVYRDAKTLKAKASGEDYDALVEIMRDIEIKMFGLPPRDTTQPNIQHMSATRHMTARELRDALAAYPSDTTVVVVPRNPGAPVDGYQLIEGVGYDEEVDVVEVWF
jgi:hypothetical protein